MIVARVEEGRLFYKFDAETLSCGGKAWAITAACHNGDEKGPTG